MERDEKRRSIARKGQRLCLSFVLAGHLDSGRDGLDDSELEKGERW